MMSFHTFLVEEHLPPPDRPPICAGQDTDAASHADELLARSISFHFMEQGVYDTRRNRAEADYIAQLVRRLLQRGDGVSIGIVAFSEAQQDEIESALDRLAQADKSFRNLLDRELEREEDGQFVGLLVKNLDNIQGDERDVIVLSVCYGYAPSGKMRMNFGPINRSGGEKRLNVAFSRAKHHMALVSSIRHSDITNDYNDGANCLKNYLRYAEAVSEGNLGTARRVLRGMSRWRAEGEDEDTKSTPFVEQVAAAVAGNGYEVDRAVGQSHFRCDLAVRRDGDLAYRLGIPLSAYRKPTPRSPRDRRRYSPQTTRRTNTAHGISNSCAAIPVSFGKSANRTIHIPYASAALARQVKPKPRRLTTPSLPRATRSD